VTPKGFTLTMWDVKGGYDPNTTDVITFYLNYVGCKANKNKLRLLFVFAFYLNYVGCKVIESDMHAKTGISFTLTMWDVKRATEELKEPHG